MKRLATQILIQKVMTGKSAKKKMTSDKNIHNNYVYHDCFDVIPYALRN